MKTTLTALTLLLFAGAATAALAQEHEQDRGDHPQVHQGGPRGDAGGGPHRQFTPQAAPPAAAAPGAPAPAGPPAGQQNAAPRNFERHDFQGREGQRFQGGAPTPAPAQQPRFDRKVEPILRDFFYLPFRHSEDLTDQDYSLALCAEAGDADNLKWAALHRDIIVRFGRFPHRNRALGRRTTPEEQEFLDDGGFAG